MIAAGLGARVIAVDIDARALNLAGASGPPSHSMRESMKMTPRVRMSPDGVGCVERCARQRGHVSNSILCLPAGRHVQVGLLAGGDYLPRIPMHRVIGWELEVCGSHGMQASRYGDMLAMIASSRLDPRALIGRTIPLEEAPQALERMGSFGTTGITVIDRF